MNQIQRNEQFLSFTAKLLKPSQAQVGAVAEAINCPTWDRTDKRCDCTDRYGIKTECYCAKGLTDALNLKESA